MKKSCTYAKKYKAIFKPKCGCAVCNEKWVAVVKLNTKP